MWWSNCWLPAAKTPDTEVDVLGTATEPSRPHEKIWLVGEVTFNLTVKDIERFAQKVSRARSHLTGEMLPACCRARPEIEEAATRTPSPVCDNCIGLRPAIQQAVHVDPLLDADIKPISSATGRRLAIKCVLSPFWCSASRGTVSNGLLDPSFPENNTKKQSAGTFAGALFHVKHTALQVVAQCAAGVAQPAERLGFDLADALAGDATRGGTLVRWPQGCISTNKITQSAGESVTYAN